MRVREHYQFVKLMSFDEEKEQIALAGLYHREYGRQIWKRCKVRKDWKCKVTRVSIESGDAAYRPITDAGNRMHRISEYGMLRLVERARAKDIKSEHQH